ncbi:PREDICTED: uncharacterized protein LOC106810710 [Priapulus caudatus]|uniref:Uncharacterized protein LOC106810710 n=1 Tax=Priapulus caudatus TaxID=37621 RepID=A0ABM1EBR0_PRICU|nr:PREDICTED: uncharacterized protein LOC106810710 [Priapulus caudatus]
MSTTTEMDITNTADSVAGNLQPMEHKDTLHSGYQAARQRRMGAWADLRPSLLSAYKKVTRGKQCIICGAEDPPIRCTDCSYSSNYCTGCFETAHLHLKLHVAYYWKNGMFTRYDTNRVEVWNCDVDHICSSGYPKVVTVVDARGRQHSVQLTVCSCNSAAVTMLRYGLWPSTPTNPQVAFTIELMELLRLLVLECQVSVKGFCEVLMLYGAEDPLANNDIRDIYRTLQGGCFEEYRNLWREARYPTAAGGDDGTTCPACPKDTGTQVFSIDGNFGLVRKKAAGIDLGTGMSPRFFLPQDQVDQYVSKAGVKTKKSDGVCSDFKAGNPLRSKSRHEKLDITGVFGAVCRHDMPKSFLNLRHGERLAYPEFLCQWLLQGVKVPRVVILYDIACVLEQHAQNLDPMSQHPERVVEFGIPIFHMYGHKVGCQVKYSPRRLSNIGLTDGEGMERLWSYLRRFNRITKEMTPDHRVALLDDALLHNSEYLRNQMGETLMHRYIKAQTTRSNCDQELEQLTSRLSAHLT